MLKDKEVASMRRILLVMSVAALMVAMMAASALPAFAVGRGDSHTLTIGDEVYMGGAGSGSGTGGGGGGGVFFIVSPDDQTVVRCASGTGRGIGGGGGCASGTSQG
jgi:hypothetical protein